MLLYLNLSCLSLRRSGGLCSRWCACCDASLRMLRVCWVFRARACMLCSVLLLSLFVSVGRPSCFLCSCCRSSLSALFSSPLSVMVGFVVVVVLVFSSVFFSSPFFFLLCLLVIMVCMRFAVRCLFLFSCVCC